MSTSATLIMPYYDNPIMLREQFVALRELPQRLRDLIRVIIVDDGSPRWPAVPGLGCGVPLEIYRVLVDVRWNQHAARNIGMHHCVTEWAMLTDMDHLVPQQTWEKLLLRDRKASARKFYMFSRVTAPDMTPFKWHPNSYFIPKALFDEVGGYDERFSGHYGTDSDLRRRLEGAGRRVDMNEVLVRVPRELIADASTTTYQRKAPEDEGVLRRVKAERELIPGWRPLRLTHPYERAFPL